MHPATLSPAILKLIFLAHALLLCVGQVPAVAAEPLDDTTPLTPIEGNDGSLTFVPGPNVRANADSLLRRLRDPAVSAKTKHDLCLHLSDLQRDGASAVPFLAQNINEPTFGVAAAVALVSITCDRGPAAPKAFREYLAVPAADSIPAEAKPAVAVLIKTLAGGNDGQRSTASLAFRHLAVVGKQVTPQLLEQLRSLPPDRDSQDGPRPALIRALADLGPMAKDAVPELRVLLKDKNSWARYAAVDALGKIGPAAAEARPALRALLGTDGSLRRAAAFALAGIAGPDAAEAVPELAALLTRDLDSFDVVWAAQALEKIGPGASGAVPAMLQVLAANKGPDSRVAVCRSLGSIGAAAKTAVPVLRKMTLDPKDDGQIDAAQAVARIDASQREAALSVLVAGLSHTSWSRRRRCAMALFELRHELPRATQVLLEMLTDKSAQDRFMSAATLRKIGPADGVVVSVLRTSLDSRSLRIRAAAADALGRIGARAGPALPRLREMANSDADPWIRQIASLAAKRIANADPKPEVKP